MKKVLILANNDVGLYKFRKELIEELIKKGNKVYISLPYGKLVDRLVEIGCEFIDTPLDRRGINPVKDFKLLSNYKKEIKRIKPDLVLTYTIKPNIYGGIASKLNKIPYIVNITGLGTAFQGDSILKNIIIFLYKIALRKVEYVFFENEGNKQTFIDNEIIHTDKAIVMNGAGVNLNEYKFTDMPKGKIIRLLFIGRIMKEKGIDELLYVANRIKNKYKNIVFDIVGPIEDNYEEIIKQYQKNNIINYYGYQEDVIPYIKTCSCFILPSYHEGMSNSLLEAAAIGRPLITSNIHGCKETVHDEDYLCDVKNQESLYNCVVKFINLPYEEKCKIGIDSREHIENIFDKKIVIKKSIDYIEEVWRNRDNEN